MRIVVLLALLAARPAAACVPLGDDCGPDTGGTTSSTGYHGPCTGCITLYTLGLATSLLYTGGTGAIALAEGRSAIRDMAPWWHDFGIVSGSLLLASGATWAALERHDRGAALAIGISAGVVGLPTLGLGVYGRLHVTPAPVVGTSGHSAPGMVLAGRF